MDFQSGGPAGGAHVAIATASTTTDAAGTYSLTVPAGDALGVTVDGESPDPVNLRDPTYRGDFYVHSTGCVALYGTVIDGDTRRAVPSAVLSFNGPGLSQSAATDYSGWFRLSLGCPGTACVGFNTTFVSVTHAGYRDGSFIAGRGVCFVRRVDYELHHK